MANGKTAIVTGAGTGIGKAVATALLKAGWNTVFTGRRCRCSKRPSLRLERRKPRRCASAADVTQDDEVDRLFDGVVKEFGRVDLLFNNAGRGFKATLIDELPVETWNEVVAVNLTGSFLCARAAFRVSAQAKPAGRAHHQQWLGVGACAAAWLGAVHGDQACHHRADQDAGARWTPVQHRLRADRYRQRADGDGRSR